MASHQQALLWRTPTTSSNGLLNNLVAYWKMDESSWNIADATWWWHTWTLNGTISYTSWLINNCISITSAQAQKFFSIANSWDFNVSTTKMSCSLRIKSSNNSVHFFTYMDNNIQEEIIFWIWWGASYGVWGTSGKPTIYCKNKWWAWYSASITVSDNARHHIVLLIDSSSIKIYVDNTLSLNQSISGTWSAWDRTLRIGNRYVSSAPYYLCYWWLMDEFWRWSEVLTTDQITALYNSWSWLPYSSFTS